METTTNTIVKKVVSLFTNINNVAIIATFGNLERPSFVGVKAYESKTSGEIANHVVCANFNYGNAIEKDLKALLNANDSDIQAIANKGFSVELVKQAIDKLAQSFQKNQNEDTQSAGSKAQSDAYQHITNSIKMHKETGILYIYALAISKDILVNGSYKTVNSKELTLCQNEVKKYFNFSTAKFRQFIVDVDKLTAVNVSGEKLMLV